MQKILLFMLILLCAAIMSYAQSDLIRKETDSHGSVIYAGFGIDSAASMNESKQLLKQLLGAQQEDEFLLTGSKTDELGFTHHYYSQHYKGVRVAYASYAVHGKNNRAVTANGTFRNVGEVETTPKLSGEEALDYATAFVHAKTYTWEIPHEEQWLKEHFNKSYYPIGELVIVKDRLGKSGKFRLAWVFDIFAHEPLSRDLIYVDALTGDVIEIDPLIHFANSPGTAATRYSGNKTITTDSYAGGYRLRETRNGVTIETHDYNLIGQ